MIENAAASDISLESAAMNEQNLLPADLQQTRSSLVTRLRDWQDHQGWQRFFDTYWKLLYCVAVKAGLSDAEARDVVQETVIAVARNMGRGQFTRQPGSFRAWLLTILCRRIKDHFRKRRWPASENPADPSDSLTPIIERIAAPTSADVEEIWETEWGRNIADAALEQTRKSISAKQYQLFDLYAVKGCSAIEVARLLKVNVAQVYLAKYRVTSLIKREIRRIEAEANAWPVIKPREGERGSGPKSRLQRGQPSRSEGVEEKQA
jgi:RNA polymerase sigma factor (sigma-70 family)